MWPISKPFGPIYHLKYIHCDYTLLHDLVCKASVVIAYRKQFQFSVHGRSLILARTLVCNVWGGL